MSARHDRSRPIGEQAAEWLCLLNEGGAKEQAAFMTWLKQSPRHVEEFLFASATWRSLQQAGAEPAMSIDDIVAEVRGPQAGQRNVFELGPDISVPSGPVQPTKRAMVSRWAAGIAGLAMLAGLAAWLIGAPDTYSTAVGEQRTVRLADGSVIHLNTASRARVRFTDSTRRVELSAGEALFVVAQDRARPFRVASGSTVIQAVGTQFNVRREAAGTRVSVIEGRVKVVGQTPVAAEPSMPLPPQLLGAGEEATVDGDGRIARSEAPDVPRRVAWRERRLIFRAERLEDVVAEINRYSTRRFRIESDRARETRLTATFDADSPESLAAFLEQFSDLSVRTEGEGFVVGEPR